VNARKTSRVGQQQTSPFESPFGFCSLMKLLFLRIGSRLLVLFNECCPRAASKYQPLSCAGV